MHSLSAHLCRSRSYDFDNLDQVPEDSLVVFCMATYGEGEPTDNAVPLMEFIKEEGVEFSNGSTLDNLRYVVFGRKFDVLIRSFPPGFRS